MYRLFSAAFTSTCLLIATVKPTQCVYGSSLFIDIGRAQTWLLPDTQGNPASMGYALSREGCRKRPISRPTIDYWPALADKATREMPHHQTTIIRTIQGHETAGIYMLLQSTCYFYKQLIHEMVTTTARANQFNQVSTAVCMTADCVEVPSSVPMMDAHGSNQDVLSQLIL